MEPEQPAQLGVLRVLQVLDKSFRIIEFNYSAECVGCITKVAVVTAVDFDPPSHSGSAD